MQLPLEPHWVVCALIVKNFQLLLASSFFYLPSVELISMFRLTDGTASSFHREMSFLHNLYDKPPCAATGIRTRVRDSLFFKGP